jgi:hypothetical protein
MRYRIPKGYLRSLVPVPAVAALLCVRVLFTARTLSPGPQRLAALVAIWSGIAICLWSVVWNAYWQRRLAHELRLDGDVLRWRSAEGGGSVALSDIRRISTFGPLSNMPIVHLPDGSRLALWIHKGSETFAQALTTADPRLEIPLGPVGRLYERLPGRSWLEAEIRQPVP